MDKTHTQPVSSGGESSSFSIASQLAHIDIVPEKTLNCLFMHSREVVLYAVRDERGTIKTISDSIATYGYSPEEFISEKLSLSEIIYSDDFGDITKNAIEQMNNGVESFEQECRVVTKQGEPVWVQSVIIPEYDKDGHVEHFLVKINDINKRKQYECELQRANQNLLDTLKSIGEAIILTDAEGHIERLNFAAEKLLGIINQKAKHKLLVEVAQFSFSADFDMPVDPLEMENGLCRLEHCDSIFMRSVVSDDYFRVSCNVSPIYAGKYKNVLVSYVLAVKDLTALYNMLQEAQESKIRMEESENTMRGIFDHSVDGIFLADDQGIIREWSHSYEKISGIPKEEVIGKKLWEIVALTLPPQLSLEERARQQTELESVVAGMKQKMLTRYVVHQQTGKMRIINVMYFPVTMSGRMMLGAMSRDVTDEVFSKELLRLNEQKLRESNTLLEIIMKTIPAPLYVKNKQGVYIECNDAFLAQFGFIREQVIGKTTFDLFPEIAEDIAKVDRNLMREDNTTPSEIRIVEDNDRLECIIHRGVLTNNDKKEGVVGVLVDISDLKNARRQQGILIKVLQILQSAGNIPEALNVSLGEIGRYAGVSRVYIFENDPDENTVNNTYEWCNEGIASVFGSMQNVPLDEFRDWYDVFDKGGCVCSSDIMTMNPGLTEMLTGQHVRSLLVIPFTTNCSGHGFVGFDDCRTNREWKQSEVELLVSLSQIISTAIRRHHAETTIRLSQQTMHTVLDNINANIYVADFDSWKILFANKKVKDELGTDIEGKICWEVLQKGQTGPCDFCPKPRLRDKQNRPTGLYRWEHRNKNMKRWYECTDAAIEWIDGRQVHIEYATDITARRKAEEALRQSEEMYRQLTVASPDAVVVCTAGGKVCLISPKAVELFDLQPGVHIHSLRIQQYIHPHDRRRALDMLKAQLRDDTVIMTQLLLLREDGSDFLGEVSSATVKNADDCITSVIMVIRDITQRKMTEIELVRAKEKAEESDKLKSAFLANMSHEIRTPLNGIISFLTILGSNNLAHERRLEYTVVVNNSCQQLAKLIDDIIDIAKIEVKQLQIHPVPVRINELMNELHVFFETFLKTKGKNHVSLILDDSGFIDGCVSFVDPMRLRQILTNLIGNAVKFTEKGYIRFGYRLSEPGMLEFIVEDTGIGIPEDQIGIIFERFRQVDENHNRYGGTGLGLTISRNLVQMMDGDIRVESAKDAGTTFCFTISYLPVAPEDECIFNKLHEEPPLLKNRTVVVVESKMMKFKYYEKLFSVTGASIVQVAGLQQCLEYMELTNHADAVVLADVSIFDNIDEETCWQIKLVRPCLLMILIVSNHFGNYLHVTHDSQCSLTLEEPINYRKLAGALKMYVG